jgi:hypothetical protein
VLYAGSSYLLKSVDGGLSWEVANSGYQFDGNPTLAIEVSQHNNNAILVSTAPVTSRAGVYYSRNAGVNFTNVTGDLPDRYPVGLAFDPQNDEIFYVTFSGFGTSHVYRTLDRGATWQNIGQGLPDVPTNAVIVDPEHANHVYVGTDLGVYVTANGGQTWHEFTTGLPDAAVCMDLTICSLNRKLRGSTYGNGVYERALLSEIDDGDDGDVPGPAVIALAQNVPNPFNAGTDITYTVENGGPARLEIFNVRGQLVATLVNGHRDRETYTVGWDGTGDDGRKLPSGTYIYRLQALGLSETRKMQLVQ